jgi:ketosteroid isomerase-like protein
MGNLERLRDIYREWAKGNFRAGSDGWDRYFMFVLDEPFPDAGVYVGAESIAGYMRGFLEPWERVAIEPLEFVGAGDSIVVPVRQHATGTGSGAPVEMRYTQVWTFRGERLLRLENFMDHEEALRAVGRRT